VAPLSLDGSESPAFEERRLQQRIPSIRLGYDEQAVVFDDGGDCFDNVAPRLHVVKSLFDPYNVEDRSTLHLENRLATKHTRQTVAPGIFDNLRASFCNPDEIRGDVDSGNFGAVDRRPKRLGAAPATHLKDDGVVTGCDGVDEFQGLSAVMGAHVEPELFPVTSVIMKQYAPFMFGEHLVCQPHCEEIRDIAAGYGLIDAGLEIAHQHLR